MSVSTNPNVLSIKHMAFGVKDAKAAHAAYSKFLDVPTDTAIIDYPKSKNRVALFELGGIEYQLCQSMDKVAAAYLADAKKAGKDVKPVATPPCADPGPFAYTPPGQKPLEAAGAHSPPGKAISPPNTNTPASPQAAGKKP